MAGNSTIYDVKVRYALDDRASKGANNISSACDKAANKAFSLKHALAAIGGAAVLKKGYDALVGFNSEIDSMKINLSTIMQLQLKMPFEKANVEAQKLFSTFQEMAKKSPATTKDFMEMSAAIAAPIAMLGGGPDKLAKLTQGAIIAGQAFSERADVVALDIKQMLMGTVSSKDRVAQQLISSQGMDSTKFNAMDATKRASLVENMLEAEPLKKAADAMGESFKGQVSTFQDMLQITLGQVGKPLMEGMTAEIKKWNTWIEKHPKMIQQYVSSFSSMIKGAFDFVKTTAGWLVEHKDLLFAIGKTFLVFKGAQIGTQVFKKFTDGIGNLVGGMKDAGSTIRGIFSGGAGGVGGAFKGLVGILQGAGGVIPALGLFAGALGVVAELLNTHAESDRKARDAALSLHEATGEIPMALERNKEIKKNWKSYSPEMKERLQQEYFNNNAKMSNPEILGTALRKISEESEKHGGLSLKNMDMAQLQKAFITAMPDTFDSRNIAENTKIMKEVESTLNLINNKSIEERREILKHAFPEQWGKSLDSAKMPDAASNWTAPKGTDVNITIQKIEVASEDPDRFVFGLVKIGEQVSKHPTTSQHATPGGM